MKENVHKYFYLHITIKHVAVCNKALKVNKLFVDRHYLTTQKNIDIHNTYWFCDKKFGH